MRSAVVLALAVAFLAACLLHTASTELVQCRGGLEVVPEPPLWSGWPTVPLDRFVFRSKSMLGPKYGLGHADAELSDPSLLSPSRRLARVPAG